jgi:hypothetical protein
VPPTATTYYSGTPYPADLRTLYPVSYMGTSVQLGFNQTPLFSRFPKQAVDGYVIQRYVGSGRPRTTTLGAGVADAVATTITLANVGFLMRGDVLQLNSGEYVQLTDHPNATANTVAVRRGVAGTTAAAQTNGTTVKLITNARGGYEEFQPSYQQVPGYVQQAVQTFQFPYKVAGGDLVIRDRRYFNGDIYQGERGSKETDLRNDIEYCALYGRQEFFSGAVDSQKMAGLFNLIQTNNITAPANAGAFKPSDFNGQVLAPLFGKEMNLALVSPGWFGQLPLWGMNALRLDAGATAFSVPIELYAVSGLPQFRFVPVPTMEGISGIFGRAQDIYWGVLEGVNDVPHGINGDARSGHWIARLAIDVADERNFVAIRNITAFAPQS